MTNFSVDHHLLDKKSSTAKQGKQVCIKIHLESSYTIFSTVHYAIKQEKQNKNTNPFQKQNNIPLRVTLDKMCLLNV